MRIGIDARLYSETGVGRYIRNLLRELAMVDTKNEYVVFLRKAQYRTFVLPNARWTKRLADVPWHSVTEQIIMPWIFLREHLDLLHIPYFNVPLLYPGKIVMTIHDLTILLFNTGYASTLPYFLYKLKRIGYRILLIAGLRKAKKIITVSTSVKKDIIRYFRIDPARIYIIYEGVDKNIIVNKSHDVGRQRIYSDPYVVYVGNAYPHKNLDVLLDALQALRDDPHIQQIPNLIFVGNDDYFYRRLKTNVQKRNLLRYVLFYGAADDKELFMLYTHARALVFPSLMEGFGLPVIEALSLGCPVICSDIPVFHEIAGNQVEYVPARSISGWANALRKIAENVSRPSKHTMNTTLLHRFNWKKTAQETYTVYTQKERMHETS